MDSDCGGIFGGLLFSIFFIILLGIFLNDSIHTVTIKRYIDHNLTIKELLYCEDSSFYKEHYADWPEINCK